jgi:hypothetical protein
METFIMPQSSFPGGFMGGLTVQNMPVLNSYPGQVFWVHSAGGSTGAGTFNSPFSTLAQAIARCVSSRGDIVMIKAGHAESITAAAGIALDKTGVTIIGLGNGSNRPTFTFTTAVGADIDIDAANITMQNLLFVAGIDALTGPIDVNAADFCMIGCETRDTTGSYQTVDWIDADANADRMLILDHVHRGATDAGAASWVTIAGADDVTIVPRFVDGNFSAACIENTAAASNLTVYGRGDHPAIMRNRNASDVIVTAHASTTGTQGPNIYARLADNAANITEAFVGAAMVFHQPISIVNNAGEVGMQTNITASTDA